jgi:hypothetical protein
VLLVQQGSRDKPELKVLPDHKVQQAPLVQQALMARMVKPF